MSLNQQYLVRNTTWKIKNDSCDLVAVIFKTIEIYQEWWGIKVSGWVSKQK